MLFPNGMETKVPSFFKHLYFFDKIIYFQVSYVFNKVDVFLYLQTKSKCEDAFFESHLEKFII